MIHSKLPAGSRVVLSAAILLTLWPLAACVRAPFGKPVTQAISLAAPVSAPTSVPFLLDGGRIYTDVVFRKADGSTRKALAWVNFGVGGMSLSPALHSELGGGAVEFALGEASVRVDSTALLPMSAGNFAQMGPLPVEAVLPAGMWPLFRVTLDYPARTLTLEAPDAPAPDGVAVPMLVNEATGLASVRLLVDGHTLPVALDAGSGYSWIRGDDVRRWLKANPGWYRADGALGASNQAMVAENVEQLGTVVRVPQMAIGPLTLTDVGVLGTAPAQGHPADQVKDAMFWKLWGQGAAEPVFGWIGGNAMRPYRVSFDYRKKLSYWKRTGEPQTGELDAVGISLIKGTKFYRIGAIVTRNGKPDLTGAKVGDRLLAIDGRTAAELTREGILQALRGTPGTRRRLTLEREGATLEVEAEIVGELAGAAPG
ncbi:PDZ domain-containing protein [Sandaracinobacteroides hominis]|uniref:hypothetical protein n=1 Tax=Sandaracinobacteroides hominis TaxID=2780086 RepID=UPI0018F4E505|nr:hypothetical protein [Sandaracinobacteroides hominis]